MLIVETHAGRHSGAVRLGFRGALFAVVSMLGLSACTSEGEAEEVSVTTLGYTLGFPSKQAAIATDTVKVYVFAADAVCADLIQAERSGASLPPSVAEAAEAPLCDYLDGTAGTIDLGGGSYTVLAVGLRGGKDFLVGCGQRTNDEATIPTPIFLTLADETQSVPETACTLLAARCSGSC